RQRAGGDGRRPSARHSRELRHAVLRTGAFADSVVHAPHPAAPVPADRYHGPAGLRLMRAAALIAVALLALALPFGADNYVLRLTTTMLMYSALAVAWNVIGGFAGYPSFATAAFFGLGAYAAGVLQLHYALPMVAAWVAGGLVSCLFAALLGLAILHLRGHYFAIGSLVVAEVLREIINASTEVTGGGMGLNLPVLKMDVDSQAQLFYYAMLAVAALALLAALLVSRGRLG